MATTETNRLLAERKENARAFIRQELKPGRAWSEKRYEYDTQPVQEGDVAPVNAQREINAAWLATEV